VPLGATTSGSLETPRPCKGQLKRTLKNILKDFEGLFKGLFLKNFERPLKAF